MVGVTCRPVVFAIDDCDFGIRVKATSGVNGHFGFRVSVEVYNTMTNLANVGKIDQILILDDQSTSEFHCKADHFGLEISTHLLENLKDLFIFGNFFYI